MRAFVFLLILANLLFLAWAQGALGPTSNPDAYRMQQQLLAERIVIVSRGEPPAEAKKSSQVSKPAEKKEAEACLRINDLTLTELTGLEGRLSEQFPGFRPVRQLHAAGANFWVFIPPLSGKPEADRKATELKRFGVPEFFIVQEAGPNRWAISLGIFSTREAAEERLEQLRVKGVKSAKLSERNLKPASASLDMTGPESRIEPLRQLLADALPERRTGECTAKSAAVP